MRIKSDDAEIYYESLGRGRNLVLLHPFPANHAFWHPISELLATRYRLILPDLRGHGESGIGDGPATVQKHAMDLARICDDAGVGRAIFAGVSIGGYVLFEFWRRYRERVDALVLSDTKAAADTDEARATRLKVAEDVEKYGPEQFISTQVPKLLGETTRATRPDLVGSATRMMRRTTVEGIAAAQRGMAERPDSTTTLAGINVPVLLVFGDEDQLAPIEQARAMQQRITGSVLKVIPRAGHYAMFEQPNDALQILHSWLGSLSS